MNLKVVMFFVILKGFLILGCKNSQNNSDSDRNILENNLVTIAVDSTIETIDSCLAKDCKVKLEEYINFDSNAFILTIVTNGLEQTHILDLPPGRTHIENCFKNLIILSSACGGSCSGNDFIFVDEERPNEHYLYCHIAENNPRIISYHINEEFEIIKIRNLKNSKEISIDISPCENEFSYPCGISKLNVSKDKLLITFDSPEDKPRQKEININEILK